MPPWSPVDARLCFQRCLGHGKELELAAAMPFGGSEAAPPSYTHYTYICSHMYIYIYICMYMYMDIVYMHTDMYYLSMYLSICV